MSGHLAGAILLRHLVAREGHAGLRPSLPQDGYEEETVKQFPGHGPIERSTICPTQTPEAGLRSPPREACCISWATVSPRSSARRTLPPAILARSASDQPRRISSANSLGNVETSSSPVGQLVLPS